MTNDFTPDLPNEDTAAHLQANAEAPDEDREPTIVPAPRRPPTAATLPVPRARRQLKAMLEATKAAMTALKKLELGQETVGLDGIAIDALVCGASDTRFPLEVDHPQVEHRRKLARDGKLNKYASYAMDEIEDVIATLEAALAALKAASYLDEPLPAEWSNLSPVPLARRLNVLGHTLLRGRIPGVNL
ncbi:hypothetical protein V1282_005629 [Nitrobacteraceae bacterium AZCC 2146]